MAKSLPDDVIVFIVILVVVVEQINPEPGAGPGLCTGRSIGSSRIWTGRRLRMTHMHVAAAWGTKGRNMITKELIELSSVLENLCNYGIYCSDLVVSDNASGECGHYPERMKNSRIGNHKAANGRFSCYR
jgi:hypothetical protein